MGNAGPKGQLKAFCWAAAVALAMVSGLTIGGCENKLDGTPNRLPSGDSSAVANNGTSDSQGLPTDASAAASGCDCLAKGMVFRFDSLQIKSLDGGDHLVVSALNPLWLNDIKTHELNFFLEIIDVAGDEFQLRIINGARSNAAGDTCLVASTESIVTMKRAGCKATNAAPSGLNVYAGTLASPKNCTTGLAVPHSIPVRNAFFEATFAPDCSAVSKGLLIEGSIGKNALDNTCTCLMLGGQMAEECGVPSAAYKGYTSENNEKGKPPKFCTECCKGCNDIFQNLNELLDSFGPLKYGCKDEKGGPAVCLSATFTAAKTKLSAPCQP
ncbi:MAG: hypothetical protein EXR77_19940 [Myxococcales bacterium]|nr:hypothetical protein [Myxococcales bacterium]